MQNSTFMWRKGSVLSATFLLLILTLTVSCKKVEHELGKDVINDSELMESGSIDTFSLETSTFTVDSVQTSNRFFGVLGSCQDPVFGYVNSELYTQARLAGNSPNFGDLNNITIDSVILSLHYDGMYGNPGDQTIEVFEIGGTEALNDDSVYYRFTTFPETGADLVELGSSTYYLDPSRATEIDTGFIEPELRIRLDTNLAWQFFNEATNNPTSFESSENFIEYFKGFKIKTANGIQQSGEGGLFYFDLNASASRLNIYYKVSGEQKLYSDIVFNSSSAFFNHIEVNQSMEVQSVIDNLSMGQKQFYTQSPISRALVKVPGISNIPPNAIIHSAYLELPVQYQTGQPFEPGLDISVAMFTSAADSTLISDGTIGLFDTSSKHFTIDVRNYVQAIVSGDLENTGFVISPLLFSNAMDRIEFNGPETTNKAKPKFKIVYTEY